CRSPSRHLRHRRGGCRQCGTLRGRLTRPDGPGPCPRARRLPCGRDRARAPPHPARPHVILPGTTLGVLGGGQLGRMFTMRAREMGYQVVVLEPDAASPAGAVADRHLRAAYDDPAALDTLAAECAAVTVEFENV